MNTKLFDHQNYEDLSQESWIILFDLVWPDTEKLNMDILQSLVYHELERVFKNHGFNKKLQYHAVFSNNPDATLAFQAVCKGLANSWVKLFIKRLHLFKVDPNSDATDLLNKYRIPVTNTPESLLDLIEGIQKGEIEL